MGALSHKQEEDEGLRAKRLKVYIQFWRYSNIQWRYSTVAGRNMGLTFGDMIMSEDIHMQIIIIEMTFGSIWEIETV